MKLTVPIVGNHRLSRIVSFLLYILSVFGCVFTLISVSGTIQMFVKGDLIQTMIGLVLTAAGVGLVILPYRIYYYIIRYINMFQLKKMVKEKGLEPFVTASVENAMRLYATAPGRIALSYIESLNPEAAKIIRLKEEQDKRKRKDAIKYNIGSKKVLAFIKSARGICLIVGIGILCSAWIYNAGFAYRYEDVPVKYAKYQNYLTIGTDVEMNVYEAVPIATETESLTNGSNIVSSSVKGVYYYVIDDRGTEGVMLLPFQTSANIFKSTWPGAEDYEIDTPLQVYGCIKETPNFSGSFDIAEMRSYENNRDEYYRQRAERNAEFNEWISNYALMQVNSLEPLTNEVRVGEGIDGIWIFAGILLVAISCILGLRKRLDSDIDYEDWDFHG